MAIRSKEFVGIAEGIKSHELSTKGKIESLRGTISELSGVKRSIDSQISYLEAALAAAYEDTDEDGDPDYGRISAIEAQISQAENELSEVEGQLNTAHGELSHSEAELESVLEEKAQTLFEIQERARITSNNIAVAGGMYGAYSGVGGSLQSSMQTSLASLSQAASILDGSVDGFSGGGSGGGGNSTGGRGMTSQGDLSTSPLSAFAAGAATASVLSGNTSPVSTPSSFTTNLAGGVTPATTPNFQSGQQSINPQKTLNFNTDQKENSYATSSFAGVDDSEPAAQADSYRSSQSSPNMEKRISQSGASKTTSEGGSPRGEMERRRAWAQQYQVGFTPTATTTQSNSNTTHPSAPKKGPRELADELDYELSIGSLLSKFGKRKTSPASATTQTTVQSSADKRNEFLQRLQADVKPVADITSATSGSTDDDDVPNIGARVRQRDDWYSDREQDMVARFGLSRTSQSRHHDSYGVQRDIDSIKNKFASFLQKESSAIKTNDNGVANAQRIIDTYCKTALTNILPESKQAVRLTDSVEFQDDEKFAMGLGGYERAAGVNGYNDGKKSYVKNSGPHPQKTAIHEHNHQLSCNDVKDKFGYITEYRRGISINGRDRQVNEALTEYFTKKMMGSEYPANPNVGYKDNMLRVEKMESGFGDKILKEAYYQNKPQLLKARYESIMGEGTWETFSRAFNESLRKYTPQEEQAIREHYLKTGTRLTTQTDIIRKKATDYANRCATLFAIKSKGVK